MDNPRRPPPGDKRPSKWRTVKSLKSMLSVTRGSKANTGMFVPILQGQRVLNPRTKAPGKIPSTLNLSALVR